MNTIPTISAGQGQRLYFFLALFFALAVSWIAMRLILPWDPRMSYDTAAFYFPSQEIVGHPNGSLREIFLNPFYIPDSGHIDAGESKPVFIVALRLWGLFYHVMNPSQPVPNAGEYYAFMFLTVLFLAGMFFMLSHALRHPGMGFWACAIVLVSPWHLIYLYYPAYTQFSAAIYLGALVLVIKNTPRTIFAAGIVSVLALLSNSSVLVYIPGLAVLILYLNSASLRLALRRTWIFLCGGIFVFAFFEMLQALVPAYRQASSPLDTLAHYFRVSLTENHFGAGVIPKYPGMMLLILKENSILGFVIMLAGAVLLFSKIAKTGWIEIVRKKRFQSIMIPFLPAILAVFMIDCGPSVQLGRSYFIAYPMFVLGLLILLKEKFSPLKKPGVWLIFLFIVYAVNVISVMATQHRTFHPFIAEPCSLVRQFVLLKHDPHHQALISLLAQSCPGEFDKISVVDDLSGRQSGILLTGPDRNTIWPMIKEKEFYPRVTGPGRAELDGRSLILKREYPFFALYPLLLFEDEVQAWKYILRKTKPREYLSGTGAIRAWSIVP